MYSSLRVHNSFIDVIVVTTEVPYATSSECVYVLLFAIPTKSTPHETVTVVPAGTKGH